jgi:hypothetical protein
MSIIDSFDFSEEEIQIVNEAVSEPPRRNDKRICICGHPMSRHALDSGKCRPARFDCDCVRKHPVLEVPNTKYFLSRSVGSGEKHALSRGIVMAQNGMGDNFNERAKWLVDMVCENPECKKPTKLYPVRVNRHAYRIYDHDKDEGVTMFFCESCREVYWDSDEAREKTTKLIRSVSPPSN